MPLHKPSCNPVQYEHPVNQPIKTLIVTDNDNERSVEGVRFDIGDHGVTLIEPIVKSSAYSYLPYFRVWRGNDVVGEFCQHKCLGVFYASPPAQEHE